MVDGYALGAGHEAHSVFRVVGGTRAGEAARDSGAEAASCQYVATGAPLPAWAEVVIMIEDTICDAADPAAEGAELHVQLAPPQRRPMWRPPGSDVRPGDVVLAAGATVTPEHVALLNISAPSQTVSVRRRLRVGVLSTGDELAPGPFGCIAQLDGPGAAPAASAAAIDANRPMLLSRLRVDPLGPLVEPVDLGLIGDSNRSSTERALSQAAYSGLDVLLTTGGVSMGDRDHVKPALARLGTVLFGRVRIKPGKPTTAALLPGAGRADEPTMLVFALPGNPVSAGVMFRLLAEPAIRCLAGSRSAGPPPRLQATCMEPVRRDAERCALQRVVAWQAPGRGLQCSRTCLHQRSSRVASLAAANALLVVDRGTGVVPPGQTLPLIAIGTLLHAPPAEITEGAPAATATDSATPAAGTMDTGCGCCPTIASATTTTAAGAPAAAAVGAAGGASAPAPARAPTPVALRVLVVSDRAAAGVYEDRGFAAARAAVSPLSGVEVVSAEGVVVPDGVESVRHGLKRLAEEHPVSSGAVPLLVVTGGTGFSATDVTPEALKPLWVQPAPGLTLQMLQAGLAHTPLAVTSRMEAGTLAFSLEAAAQWPSPMSRAQSAFALMVPGKPKAIGECVQGVAVALTHVLRMQWRSRQ